MKLPPSLQLGRASWLAVGVCASVVLLTWFGYRALRGWHPERIEQLHLRGWLARICLNLARNRARDLGVRGGGALPIDDVLEPSEPRRRSHSRQLRQPRQMF